MTLERQYGPAERTMNVIGHNGGYSFKHFQQAQLQGNINITIEDGTNVPKTPLGKRAAIEHANQLMLLGPNGESWKPDERHKLLQTLGVNDLVEGLDAHTKSALGMQDEFEQWAKQGAQGLQEAVQLELEQQAQYAEVVAQTTEANAASAAVPQPVNEMGNPMGEPAPAQLPIPEPPPSPLRTISPLSVQLWHDPNIHYRERVRWMLSDAMKELVLQNPELAMVVTVHMQQLLELMAPPGPPPMPGPQSPPKAKGAAGAAQAMPSSNANAGSPAGNTKEAPI